MVIIICNVVQSLPPAKPAADRASLLSSFQESLKRRASGGGGGGGGGWDGDDDDDDDDADDDDDGDNSFEDFSSSNEDIYEMAVNEVEVEEECYMFDEDEILDQVEDWVGLYVHSCTISCRAC